MLGFVIQRLLQALVVMLVISVAGLRRRLRHRQSDRRADLARRRPATSARSTIARYGLDLPLWQQYFALPRPPRCAGDFGRSFVFNMPVLELILSRLPATLELTLAAVIGATLIGVPLGMYAGYRPDSVARQVDHGAVDPRLLGADLLDRPRADPHLRGRARLAAGRRTRRRPSTLFGVEWSFLTLNGWSHLFLPALNLALFKFAMMIAPGARRHARGDADRHGASSPARPASPNGRSCAAMCCG